MISSVPRGSPLSLLLLIVYLDDFFATCTAHTKVMDTTYVDNITICAAGTAEVDVLERLSQWFDQLNR